MRKTTTWAAAAGLAAVLSAGTMFAQPAGGPGFGPGHGHGRRGGGPMGMGLAFMGRELGVTDAQRDQIKAIMESRKAEFEAIAERGRTARTALHEATTADTVDEQAIRDRAAAVAAVEADAAVLRAKVHAEIFQNVLTAEQREKAKELRSKFDERGRRSRRN